jgi:hypothetical protein
MVTPSRRSMNLAIRMPTVSERTAESPTMKREDIVRNPQSGIRNRQRPD